MECLKSGLGIFLKRSIQTSIVNSHTVTYKSLAPADNPTQLEFICSGHIDYYIDLNSVRLLLRVKFVDWLSWVPSKQYRAKHSGLCQ
jgi:hypothetical protein